MKKYRVIQKGNGAIFGEFETRVQAAKEIMRYLNDLNDGGVVHLSPFDFEEIECDVNEVITDFETARKALGIKPNYEFTVVRTEHSDIEFNDVASLVDDINPNNIEMLIALNKLSTIAEAWNKEDGFVPDFSDSEQEKWFPWFRYNKHSAWFVFHNTIDAPNFAFLYFGSQFCFKTEERAEQFGKQFEDLFNKVLMNKRIKLWIQEKQRN